MLPRRPSSPNQGVEQAKVEVCVHRKRHLPLAAVEFLACLNKSLPPPLAERARGKGQPRGPYLRSNLRWCSDGLEFTRWNGDILRLAFIIDAFDREIIAWTAVSGAGISGSDVRDMMLEAVEKRFAD